MHTIKSVILETIKNKRLMPNFISEKTEISQNILEKKLNGNQDFNCSEFIAICSFLGLKPNDFKKCQK